MIKNSLNPVWNEQFEIVIDNSKEQKIKIELYNWNHNSSDEFLGRIELDPAEIKQAKQIDKVRMNWNNNCHLEMVG